MKILMTTPNKRGGVTAFCRSVSVHLPGPPDLFIVGSREGSSGTVANILRIPADYLAFLKKILSVRYDVVHINPSFDFKSIVRDSLFLLIAKLSGLKVIVFIHGWNPRFEQRVRHRGTTLLSSIYNTADGLIVLSSAFKTTLKEFGIRKNICCMTTVVTDELLDACSGAMNIRRTERREELQLLFMSRVERDKGIFETLEAFGEVQSGNTAIRLCVAGVGSALDQAKEYVRLREIQGVSFAGWIDGKEKVRLLLESDMYLFPTNHGEGIPIALLEAMAAGIPVITRPMGGIRDFFDDPAMGILLHQQTTAELASAIQRLVGDAGRRLAIGEYNHRYARDHFSASAAARRLEEQYREVLNDRA